MEPERTRVRPAGARPQEPGPRSAPPGDFPPLPAPNHRETVLTRTNPLTKIVVMVLITLGVVLTIDVYSAAAMMLMIACFYPLAGISVRRLFTHLWFIPITAVATGWATVLLAKPSGDVAFHFGLYTVTTGALELGAAIFLRSLAMALPCVLLAMTIDSTELADSLVQVWRLPQRFVLGALGAARLAGLLSEQLETLQFARRARGIAHGGPLGAVLDFFPLAYALLAEAIRRATRLAMAMEGRAFGTSDRTCARSVRLHARDWITVGVATVMCAVSITVSVTTGHWNFILS